MNQRDIEQRMQEDFLAGDSGVTYLGAGGVVAGILRAISFVLAQIYYEFEQLKRKLFLATVTGSDLDRLGEERGIYREGASSAGVVLSVRGVPGTVLPSGTRVRSSSGIIFQTTSMLVLGNPFSDFPDSTAPRAYGHALKSKVYARALTTGSVGNLPAKSINTFVSTVPSAISSITNDFPSEGGADIESDTLYRARIIRQTAESERTTQNFYYAIAKNHVTLGEKILRTKAVRRGVREVVVIVVTKSGSTLTPTELTSLTSHISVYAPILTTVTCENISFTPVSIRVKVEKTSGRTNNEVYAQIADALVKHVNWSLRDWGNGIDDADLINACNVSGYVENVFIDDFYTHLDGGGLPIPGDISVPVNSLPRLVSLNLTIFNPAGPDEEMDSLVEDSYEYES